MCKTLLQSYLFFFFVTILHLFVQNSYSFEFPSNIINKSLLFPQNYDFNFDPGFNIAINILNNEPKADVLISKISVIIDMTHENPSELQITLTDPVGFPVVLQSFGQSNAPTASQPFNSSNTPILKELGGRKANGTWKLSIIDNQDGNIGRINYWQINIDTQENVLFQSDTEKPSFTLQIDGFGSFGDQNAGTNAAAIYKPDEDSQPGADKTVFHSTLYLPSENIFLSGYDIYPSNVLTPNLFVSIDAVNNISVNTFQTEKTEVVWLTQKFSQESINSTTSDFTLKQEYDFNFLESLKEPYRIIRYFNSKLDRAINQTDYKNYPAINLNNDYSFKSIAVFNEIGNSNDGKSTFIEIGYELGLNCQLFGYQIQPWYQNGQEFPNELFRRGLEYFNPRFGNLPFDSNMDNVTDPDKGFDPAILIGLEFPAGTSKGSFTMITTWGFSSPNETIEPTSTPTPLPSPTAPFTPTPIPTSTHTFTPTSTQTFTPTATNTFTNTNTATATRTFTPVPSSTNTNTHTPTFTPTSTNTFTPTFTHTETHTPTFTETSTPTATNTNTATPEPSSTPTPTPTSTNTYTPTSTATNTFTPTTTATPINQPPQWIKRIPDLRFRQNEEAQKVVNLDEYVYDSDTDDSAIIYNIIKPDDLPIFIQDRSYISMGNSSNARDFGFITIQASDGRTTIAQNIRVKVSTFLTRSYHQIPPVILQSGEEWISPYSLNDLVIRKLGDEVVDWTINSSLQGISEIEITEDDKIRLLADNNLSAVPQSLSFIAQRGGFPTITPTETHTPTATFTHTPTATNTPTETNTPTATETAVPSSTLTPTFSNTPTATFTHTPTSTSTNTATPTRTPTPQRTIVPSVTPSPTPTPTLGCSLRFNFNTIVNTGLMTGPVELVGYPNSSLQPDKLYVTHLDAGDIGVFNPVISGLQQTGVIDAQVGSTNSVLADLNNDGVPDAIVLNVLDEQIELYLSAANGSYALNGTLPLNSEGIVQYDEPLNGFRYRGIALESVDNNTAIIVLRTQSSLLRIQVQNISPRFSVISRTAVNGNIRFIQSADFDGDGDKDIVAAVNSSAGAENMLIYRLNEDGLTLQNTIRVDTDFEGNFAREMVLKDFNADGSLDIALVTFSNAVRILGGDGNLNFTVLSTSTPFPPGVVQAVEAGDIDGNGSIDLVALHEDQNGLNLFVLCGNQPLRYTERLLIRIQTFVLQGQQYHLRLMDLDKDSDLDIVFTRSFFDDVISVENLAR